MARIRCKYIDCAFLDDCYCSAAMVELDSDKGCLTYSPNAEISVEDDWEETEETDEWEDIDELDDGDNEDVDPWMDEEEDEF